LKHFSLLVFLLLFSLAPQEEPHHVIVRLQDALPQPQNLGLQFQNDPLALGP
jgi:hypothetical protein